MEPEDCPASLQDLAREFREQGLFGRPTGRVVFQLFLHVCIWAAGVFAFAASRNPAVRCFAALAMVFGSVGVASNTHNSSHYATSSRRWVNELLTFFGFPFFLGISAFSWWHGHIKLHHPATNVIGTDEFADVSPFFLRTREQLPAGPRLLRFYYLNLQVPALFLVLLAGGFNAQRVGWMHLYTGLRNTRTRNWKNWVDLVALVLHYVCFLAIPALLFDAALVFEIYLVRLLCAGYGVFAVLAPGHYPPEAVCLEGLPRDASSAEHVTATTINIRTGPLGRLLCSGGDYHIEHHLFPNISFVFYPQMSERLRAYCRRNGLAYRSYRWDVALLKCLATFRRPPAITRAAEFGEVSRRLGSVP